MLRGIFSCTGIIGSKCPLLRQWRCDRIIFYTDYIRSYRNGRPVGGRRKKLKADSYYYKQLTKQQQAAYHAMLTGLDAIEPSFPVPRLSAQELSDIFFLLRLDHPEIFWAAKFTYRFYQQADSVELIPEYLFKKKQVQQHRAAMEARITKLVRQAEGKSTEEMERFVHDFICSNVTYDKLKRPYAHEIIGPLGQGVGVCEGIAKSVKVLCDRLNLWCIIALSGNNPEKGIKYRHTWNVIQLDGRYYHLDATFDNSLTRKEAGATGGIADRAQKRVKGKPRESENPIRYDYFNIPDSHLFRDHEPVLFRVPECSDSSRFWYKEQKLSFTKLDEVRSRAAQAAKKGGLLTFHWRGGYLTRELLQEMIEIFNEEAEKRGRYACLSLNWPQAVLCLCFSEELPQQKLVLQEANEGESTENNEAKND